MARYIDNLSKSLLDAKRHSNVSLFSKMKFFGPIFYIDVATSTITHTHSHVMSYVVKKEMGLFRAQMGSKW